MPPKGFLAHAVQTGCGFSVGFELLRASQNRLRRLDETEWQPALRQDCEMRDGAAVAEATQALAWPAGWPEGARLLVRREPLHPGAQQTVDNIDGYRFTALLTDQADADIVTLEQRHRARAEDRIADLNDLGMAGLPCDDFDRNAVWLHLALLAMNLLALDLDRTRSPGQCGYAAQEPARST
jgi:hypothetical protein